MIINEKPWTHAKEVCRALEYNRKTADVVKAFRSRENYAQKYQMNGFTAAGKPVNLPKASQKYNIYANEEGMYYVVFGGQQPKAKAFRKHCYNVIFPQIRQQLKKQNKGRASASHQRPWQSD